MDGVVQGTRRQGTREERGPASRPHRQTRERQAEDHHRRALCRGQGRDRRLFADRGPRSRPGRRTLQGLPNLRVRRCRRSAAGLADQHVMEPGEQLGDHLFRRESGRMVATLTRIFGVHNLALAEDVVQDAFCRALEVWKFRGVPENPSAWLMATAKNRAIDVLRRERTARTFAPELGRFLESEWTLAPAAADSAPRLPAVHRALYLLFNEGYHGASAESAVRVELCREAMRLAALLAGHALAATPATFALSALLSLHAARLPARLDSSGELRSLFNQDRSQWDAHLAEEGQRLLELSASGPELTEYHLEAAIAWAHATAPRAEDTNWGMIVSLYDRLLAIRPSPVVALNRAIAIAQRDGPERGLEEIRAIANSQRLAHYPFYHAALGEFEFPAGRPDAAREHFPTALAPAPRELERTL